MIDEQTKLTIKIGDTIYNLSHWQRYRCQIGGGQIYPDLFRLTYEYSFEVLIGLKLNYKDYLKYKTNPQSCIWKVYTEGISNDFNFIIDWYKNTYGTLEVSYDQVGLATKRIDGFLLKYNKLVLFT